MIFASNYINDKDVNEFVVLMKQYYWGCEQIKNVNNSTELDQKLVSECRILINRAMPDNELIDYYIHFMQRNNLNPVCGNFGKGHGGRMQIAPQYQQQPNYHVGMPQGQEQQSQYQQGKVNLGDMNEVPFQDVQKKGNEYEGIMGLENNHKVQH